MLLCLASYSAMEYSFMPQTGKLFGPAQPRQEDFRIGLMMLHTVHGHTLRFCFSRSLSVNISCFFCSLPFILASASCLAVL